MPFRIASSCVSPSEMHSEKSGNEIRYPPPSSSVRGRISNGYCVRSVMAVHSQRRLVKNRHPAAYGADGTIRDMGKEVQQSSSGTWGPNNNLHRRQRLRYFTSRLTSYEKASILPTEKYWTYNANTCYCKDIRKGSKCPMRIISPTVNG